MNLSLHLRQSLCVYTGRKVSGSMVLAEVDIATFVGLWDDECLMVLPVSISLYFLKKNSHSHV